jgi:DNA-binding NarL/FixJ family response regulator
LASIRLTERDGEVPRFTTAGLSKLVVGVETVKTHVGNVLTKFGVRDRRPGRDRGVRVRIRHAHTVIGVRGTRVSDGSGTCDGSG